ncbi:hypothetical protein DRQ25_05360 [Candidatus Fermentibacteria bacterium]|nr:MAG: hypothetical protein DRQ25_05360 [Candidatus Fermentibacteria bacterium]
MYNEVRETAKHWLEKGRIDCFIGFSRRVDGSVIPVRITDPADADKLFFGHGCVHNLMSFIKLDDDERTGILLKGCDGRTMVQLIAEGELDRDRISVLGIVCPGLEEDGKLLLKCALCRTNTPPDYDELIHPDGVEIRDNAIEDEELSSIEQLSRAERFKFFMKHFNKCIRCYACRDVCPLCYCRECVTEKSSPQWVEVSIKPSSNAYWNLIRAYHLAGRCVNCGECDRACPVGIPLRILNRKLANIVEEFFEYVPGTSPEITPAMLDFREEDEHQVHGTEKS